MLISRKCEIFRGQHFDASEWKISTGPPSEFSLMTELEHMKILCVCACVGENYFAIAALIIIFQFINCFNEKSLLKIKYLSIIAPNNNEKMLSVQLRERKREIPKTVSFFFL